MISLRQEVSILHKWYIYIILFANGYQFILPVPYSDSSNIVLTNLPQWAMNFEVIHGVFLADFLFILYLFFIGFRYINDTLKFKKALQFALAIIGLSIAGILSSFVNFEIISDYFEAIKLSLFALFFLFVVFWTSNFGPVIVLRVFMLGLTVSGIVNLYFTFSNPIRLLGGLPMLLGQNGPGGSAGFLMFLAAWFSVLATKKMDKLLVILYILINSFLLMISYSKLGMLMGLLGILSVLFLQFRSSRPQLIIKRIAYLFVFLFSFFTWLFISSTGEIITEGASAFYEQKIGDDSSGAIDSGDMERLYYYFAVGEVFVDNPMFGVGYNGFFKAISKTNAYSTGEMSEEDSSLNANPHNAFLYYISANGIIGWILTVCLYFLFLRAFYCVLKPYGLQGFMVFCCIGGASLIHTNTLIGFFNTTIMYLPVGVAYALNNQRDQIIKKRKLPLENIVVN
ncbi:hypothetical protein HME7025_02488 [Aquirufa nivalisilvae]|uniref:O-antigen ligase-related domain-containing protein n=1 Tax=Aquirufa nivalisilvae TaxID=2516557 RepID=A0A2S2DY54_9BACT|nr:O-antigen ligase family protein [Aquirufa nivalisilvae]AWL10328.1 hypothetical protein HME7025_02488 [Aquirufa nivalisilvae]